MGARTGQRYAFSAYPSLVREWRKPSGPPHTVGRHDSPKICRKIRPQLSALQDARSARTSDIGIGIPTVLWWIVGLGAAITLAMVSLLDFPMTKHLVFGGVLAFFIGAMISVIAAMDNPFSGADRIGAERIQELLDAVPPR